MLKLTTESRAPGERLVRVEGHLDARTAPALAELARETPHTIDLGGLVSLDRAGRDLLVGLARSGSRLTGGSMHVRAMLGEVTP